MIKYRPEQCPRFNRCSAPLCPLDPHWIRSKMLRDEHICYYLTEASKAGAHERFRERHDFDIYMVAEESLPGMRKVFKELDREIRRASKRPSVIPMVQLDLDLGD